MQSITYPCVVKPEKSGGFTVSFPDMDECFTEGDTLEEALFNAAEVLSLTLEGRIDEGLPVPKPSRIKGATYVAPEARTQAALLVRAARGDRPLSEVARAMGTSWPAAQRLENPRHSPTLKQLERAAAALGKRLVLGFE
ncbi:MAG: type II toxin-antitoxin system HicB family antitoxin [Burkholderiaceae bacterium]